MKLWYNQGDSHFPPNCYYGWALCGNFMNKPEEYVWKKEYSAVLLANAFYVVLFYFLMQIFS